MIHNPNFKVVEFDHFRMQAAMPNFVMSVKHQCCVIRSALWDALPAKNDGMPQGERLVKLNQIAIQQMQVLEENSGRNLLK